MLRIQPDPPATVRHLRGETVVGASDAEGAPGVTRSRGGKRSRGAADNDPAEGLFIPGCGWVGMTLWEEGSREPLLQERWMRTKPILIDNLTAEAYAEAVERRLSPQERARAQLQNDLAAFLKEQRRELTLKKDRAQLWRALWLLPGLRPTLEELDIPNPGPDEDRERREFVRDRPPSARGDGGRGPSTRAFCLSRLTLHRHCP